MLDTLDIRTNLMDLADRANAAHFSAEKSATDAVSRAIEAGLALLQARTLVVHSEWLAWLKENFHASRVTAWRYMSAAANRHKLQANVSRVKHSTLTAAIKSLTKAGHAAGETLALIEPSGPAVAVAPLPPEAKSTDSLESLIAAGEKFGTIYADPPWQYGNQSTRAATDNHYPTMTLEAIAALPVRQLAADDAHLHLWTTNAFLPASFGILEAWGFDYRSVFVWKKPRLGIGNYWRVSHEFLMLGIRGDAKSFADHSLDSCVELERGSHSTKPEAVRKMIEKASPGPRLEMFGRRLADGWTVWGNQIARTMFDVEVA